MTTSTTAEGLAIPDRVVSVAKVSSLAFVREAERLWREEATLLIGEAAGIGLSADRQVTPEPGGGWCETAFERSYSEAIAQISLTSGTTGRPKAIAISRRAISDTVDRLLHHMELDRTVREYVGVPVTFSFGLGRIRAVAAAGGSCFIPSNGFRGDEFAKMLAQGQVNALSAVPTMLRSVLMHRDIFADAGKNLRWLEIGSQYMSAEEKREIADLFPNALILQHYGMTEASRSTFLRIDRAPQADLESVGAAVGKGAIRIGEGGRIEVSGPHLASGMVVGGKLEPLAMDEGWLRTSDIGELRDAKLFFLGRADDVANIGGIKVSTEFLEAELKNATNCSSLSVCVIRDTLRGEKVGIAVPPGQRSLLEPIVRKTAAAMQLGTGDIAMAEIGEVPRTETGKVQRAELARMIMDGDGRTNSPSGNQESPAIRPMTASEARIAAIWKEALDLDTVNINDNFHDLGGDSLSAVGVMIRAEKAGIPEDLMQRMFAGDTVAEIAAAMDSNGEDDRSHSAGPSAESSGQLRALRADGLNAVRGLFALLIVASHFGPFVLERMGRLGEALWTVLGPLLRIGTPGFAMAFGMGLGLFFFGQVDKGKARLRKRLRRNTALLLGGVSLLAVLEAARLEITGAGFGPIWPEQLFYGVLLFYLLMVPTSLFWLKQVAKSVDPVFASLLLAVGAYAIYAASVWIMPVNRFEGWASLAWHMLVAPYAYTRLLGAVALGLSAALFLQKVPDIPALADTSRKLGVVLGALGFLFVAAIPGGWTANAGSVMAVPAFAGLGLLLYSGAVQLMRNSRRPLVMRFFIVCGMLAFPIFIGQGVVTPTKSILEALGLGPSVAIALSALAFLAVMIWMGWRVYRLMFAGKAR